VAYDYRGSGQSSEDNARAGAAPAAVPGKTTLVESALGSSGAAPVLRKASGPAPEVAPSTATPGVAAAGPVQRQAVAPGAAGR
jgi:hypothetical protein